MYKFRRFCNRHSRIYRSIVAFLAHQASPRNTQGPASCGTWSSIGVPQVLSTEGNAAVYRTVALPLFYAGWFESVMLTGRGAAHEEKLRRSRGGGKIRPRSERRGAEAPPSGKQAPRALPEGGPQDFDRPAMRPGGRCVHAAMLRSRDRRFCDSAKGNLSVQTLGFRNNRAESTVQRMAM